MATRAFDVDEDGAWMETMANRGNGDGCRDHNDVGDGSVSSNNSGGDVYDSDNDVCDDNGDDNTQTNVHGYAGMAPVVGSRSHVYEGTMATTVLMKMGTSAMIVNTITTTRTLASRWEPHPWTLIMAAMQLRW